MAASRFILLGDGTPANSIRFSFPNVPTAADALRLYDSMYESSVSGQKVGTPSSEASSSSSAPKVAVTAARQAAFGQVPNYRPFVPTFDPPTIVGEKKLYWPRGEEKPFKTDAAQASWLDRTETTIKRKSINVHQCAFALTSGDSIKPILFTQSMDPCITLIVWNKRLRTAALCHVDRLQDSNLVVNALFDRVTGTPDDPVLVYFHGGNCSKARSPTTGQQEWVSWGTATGLLLAMLERNDTASIKIAAFDVVERPHGPAVAFDTRDGSIWPDIGLHVPRLDSLFRFMKVEPGFSQAIPEDFFAEKSGDILGQMMTFNNEKKVINNANGGEQIQIPILESSIHLPRLQADLRMQDTARGVNANAPAPILAFLSDMRRILFNWATLHLLSLATKAKKEKYPVHDLYVVVLSGAVGISQDLILKAEQIPAIFSRLARFEAIVRTGAKFDEANTFVSYLTTLAMAMDAGKSVSDLKGVSDKWISQYEPRLYEALKDFLELES